MTLPYKGAQARIAKQKVLILKELEKCGIVTQACKQVGISRRSYYRWKDEDLDFAEQANEAKQLGTGIYNDVAESQLLQLIKAGDFKGIKYWLERRHPDFNANYRFAELKCKMFELPSYDPEDIVLSPDDEQRMLEALGGIREFQRVRAAEASNPDLFKKIVGRDGSNDDATNLDL